jgi:cold shock CspA family protein
MAKEFAGSVKWFDVAKGFGFVETTAGDVFVGKGCDGLLPEHYPLLVKGTRVEGEFARTFEQGEFRLTATALSRIVDSRFESYGRMLEPKGDFVFVELLGEHAGKTAFLHESVAHVAGFTLAEETPVRVLLREGLKGLVVDELESGVEILDDVLALEAEAKLATRPAVDLGSEAVAAVTKSFRTGKYGFVTVNGKDHILPGAVATASGISAQVLATPGTAVKVTLRDVPKGKEVTAIVLAQVADDAAPAEVPAESAEAAEVPAVEPAQPKRKLRRTKRSDRKEAEDDDAEMPMMAGPAEPAASTAFADALAAVGVTPLTIVGGLDHPGEAAA